MSSQSSRRLHPRLRVLRNRSAEVNGLRSEIATTVASRSAVPEEPESGARDSFIAAQERLPSLDSSAISLKTSRLPVRQKLDESEPANEAFVNVFVEVLPESAAGEVAVSDRDDPGVARLRELPASIKPLRGTVIRRGNIISATVPVSSLIDLERDEAVSFVSSSEALKLDIPTAASARRPSARRVGKRSLHDDGADVIIGIIDVGGFDFAHPDFLDENGDTRFISIWDQGGEFRDPPGRFEYGTEFRKEHLDRAIRDSETTGIPARELERQSQRRESSHGTHVASIAAGNRGVCRKAEIAAVLIDVPLPDDEREQRRFAFSDTSRIAHAVDYLLDLASERGKSISINISLGTNGGAHDGSGGVSRWLDHALTTPGRAVCVAAGNAGQEGPSEDGEIGWIMGRIHTSGQIQSRGLETVLEWTVVGNGLVDVSENELEIWYGAQDRFAVSVKPPGEDRWYEVKPCEYRENERLSDGTTLSIYNELYHPGNGANYIAIYLSPNLDADDFRGVKAGVWQVKLHGDEIRDGRFHAWIERDDPVEIGRDQGQRYFRFPSFFTAQSNVDSHSISSLACGQNVIAVANTDCGAQRINISSSQGPTRDDRQKPEISASGTDVVAAKGFSNDSEEWVSMTGTSMASPYVAGVIGLMLAANPELNAAQCIGILQRTAQPLPGHTYDWRNDSGFGQITPEAAIVEAATFTQRTPRS